MGLRFCHLEANVCETLVLDEIGDFELEGNQPVAEVLARLDEVLSISVVDVAGWC